MFIFRAHLRQVLFRGGANQLQFLERSTAGSLHLFYCSCSVASCEQESILNAVNIILLLHCYDKNNRIDKIGAATFCLMPTVLASGTSFRNKAI